MEDAQQHNYVVVGAAGSGGVDSLMSHSSQSNETDNTVNANSLELKVGMKFTSHMFKSPTQIILLTF